MSIVGVELAEQNLDPTESYAPRGVGFAALRGGDIGHQDALSEVRKAAVAEGDPLMVF